MSLTRIVLSIVAGVVVWLVCLLIGIVLISLSVSWAVAIGGFIHGAAPIIGLLAGTVYYLKGSVNIFR